MRGLAILFFFIHTGLATAQIETNQKKIVRSEIQDVLEQCDLQDYNSIAKFKSTFDNQLFNSCTIGKPHFSKVFNKTIFKVEKLETNGFKQDVFYYSDINYHIIYAKETELTIFEKDTITWSCEYFFDDGKLEDWVSLGHGKTEAENWKPQVILEKFQNYLSEYID